MIYISDIRNTIYYYTFICINLQIIIKIYIIFYRNLFVFPYLSHMQTKIVTPYYIEL